MADGQKNEILKNASERARASGHAGSVEQPKRSEQIAASKHLAPKDGAGTPHRRLRFNKIVLPMAGGSRIVNCFHEDRAGGDGNQEF